jgi:hypothetical protein
LSALSASAGAAGLYLYGASGENQSYNNNIYINGKPKLRNTTLAVSAASASTIIRVISSTGWNIGDRLVISTENVANLSSSSVGVLSSTNIVSMTGNNITISPGLNTSRSAGTPVSNFTSNVNIKSFNPVYASYGIYIIPGLTNKIDINYIGINGIGNGVQWTQNGVTTTIGWTNYSYTGTRNSVALNGTPIGGVTFYVNFTQINGFTVKGIVLENPIGSSQHYGLYINGKWAETMIIEDYAALSPNGNGYGMGFNTQASANVKNSVIHRSSFGILMNTSVPNNITFDNVYIDGTSSSLAASLNGLNLNIINSRLRTNSYVTPLDAIQSAAIKNSSIHHVSPNGGVIQPNVNASGSLNFSNCNFYYNTSTGISALSSITKNTTGSGNKSAQSAEVTIFQANGNLFDYRRFNYYHYSQADLTVRKRGITSFRIKPEIANIQFYNYFTLPAVADTPQIIKGSLRFDSNYGTAYPPSINFNGAGVDTTFTCTSTVNEWQDFDLTLTPKTTDNITITITCQSSATNGFVWLDGLPVYPYIQNVRHYGFVFDKASDRTINTLNTLTENQVSALSTVNNLDYLYDEATYWSVLNPSLTSYIDLVTVNGSVLDFGNRNITVTSNVGTGFAYNSASNTIIINSDILSAGNNFNTLKTTGNLILSGTSTVSNITLNASLSQLIPVDLTGVVITGQLTYNTNVASQITYTNCTVTSATNVGSANIIIKKINSTITYA